MKSLQPDASLPPQETQSIKRRDSSKAVDPTLDTLTLSLKFKQKIC